MSLVTIVVTFTRSDAGEIRDWVLRAMWEGIVRLYKLQVGKGGGGIIRATAEAIVGVMERELCDEELGGKRETSS